MRSIFTLGALMATFLSALHANNPITHYRHPAPNQLPNDISFCIADLKFDGKQIYVCEFGEGVESQFKGYDALYHKGALWERVWQVLGSYGMPMWLVENTYWQQHAVDFAYSALRTAGGQVISDVRLLEAAPVTKKNVHQRGMRPNPNAPGIVIAHTLKRNAMSAKTFAAQFPTLILLGRATTRFVRSKEQTNNLFTTPLTQRFKPKTLLIKKHYQPGLAEKILRELGTELVVIKPTNSSVGHGVIIVPKRDLDATLRLILQDQHAITLHHNGDRSYTYWIKDGSPSLIVEAFAPSKPLEAFGKLYDPTLRMAFVMSNMHGRMSLTYVGSYWKLPEKSLQEAGTMIEKHKSAITRNHACSYKVADEDFSAVAEQLNQLLPSLYEEMLQQSI